MATSREQATKPPTEGMDLASEPVQRSTSLVSMPKCSSVPRPVAPRTPEACASSTSRKAPNSFLMCDQLRQAADVAVHREDAVGDDEGAVGGLSAAQLFAQAFGIVVAEALDLHAGHAAGVEQAAVAKAVDDDAVVGTEQAGDQAEVGHVAGAEGERGLCALVFGQIALHLLVNVEGAGEQAGAAGAGAVAMDGVLRGGVDPGMSDQTEIVVGGHHQHVMSIGLNARACLGLERHVEGVRVYRARHRGAFEDSAGAGVEQIVLLEAPLAARCEVPLKHLPGGGGEDLGGLFDFSVEAR